MTPRQRIYFFRDLWPAACRLQGWEETDRAKRLEVLGQILGREVTSIAEVDNSGEFDQVKARLLFLADNLQGAIEDGHPEIGEARRLRHVIRASAPAAVIHKILQDKFSDGYGERRLEDLDHDLEALDHTQLQQMLYTIARWSVRNKKRTTPQPATVAAMKVEVESELRRSELIQSAIECPF